MKKRKRVTAALAAALLSQTSMAGAAALPCNSIKIIVPFGPGAATSVQMHIIAKRLEERLGVKIIIENKPGADGDIAATEFNAIAGADSCTLLAMPNGMMGLSALKGDRPWSPFDPKPLTKIAKNIQLLVVNNSLPVYSVDDLIAYAKANPGKLSYAKGNNSGLMAGEYFKKLAGIDMVRISYKDEAAALPDLLSKEGRVQVAFVLTAAGYLEQVESGNLRAVAVMDSVRYHRLPNVPTIIESHPEFGELARVVPTGALFAQKGAPSDLVKLISKEAQEVLLEPSVIESIKKLGSEPVGSSPEALDQYRKEQVLLWKKIVNETGISDK